MIRKSMIASSAVLMLMPGFNSVVAQDDNKRVIEEITVTAAKREQTLQEIPVAVSVVGADTVEKAAIVDMIDLQSVIPSLRVDQLQTSSQTNFRIRGFGNGANNTGIESSVGVFIDGVYRSRSLAAMLDLPVLERIEVLRGPQSTLFGKNTSAGAINIITKGPSQEAGGSIEGSYGNYNQVAVKGTVTGPISDVVSYRLSGSYNNRDGYYTNELLDTDINERNRWGVRGQLQFDPSEKASFRFIADYNKIEEVCCGALQLFNGPATDAIGAPAPFGPGAAVGQDADPSLRTVNYDVNPVNELVGQGVSLQGDFDLGFATLTSITAYRKQTDASDSEVDFSGADIANIPAARDFKTFTQEFRLTSNDSDSDLDWLLGAFYFDEGINTGRSVFFGADTRLYLDSLTRTNFFDPSTGALDGFEAALGLPAGTFFADGSGIIDNYTMDNTSYSLNGQFDYHISDKLTFTGGVAYLKDKKTVVSDVTLTEVFSGLDLDAIGTGLNYQGAFAAAYAPYGVVTSPALTDPVVALVEGLAPGTFAAVSAGAAAYAASAANPLEGLKALQFFAPPVNYPNGSETGKTNDHKVVYSAKLAYQVNDDVNVYASYSTGWKARAFNLSSDSRPPTPNGIGRTADPEFVKVMELGLKAKFDRGNIYVAVFDQTIEGFQSNIFNGSGFSLANAGKQSVKGFEIEATYLPTNDLKLDFALTYLDPLYDSFVGAACASHDTVNCGAGEVTRDLSGTVPPGIHEISMTLGATYSHEFDNGMTGFIRGNYIYESEVDVIENVPAAYATRETNTLNMSMGVALENGLEVTAWGRNLTNDDNLLSAFPTVIQTGSYSGYLNAPRTYGVTIRKRF